MEGFRVQQTGRNKEPNVMHSKNKKAMTSLEREHVTRIKEMGCIICSGGGPSEAHEIEQGQWFTSLPLCADCHRGAINGIHGQKRMWNIYKLDELKALNLTLQKIFEER